AQHNGAGPGGRAVALDFDLSGPLAASVRSLERGLGGRAIDDRHRTPGGPERRADGRREAGIDLRELARIHGAVRAGEVKDEVSALQGCLQGVCARPTRHAHEVGVAELAQAHPQVPPDEAVATGDDDPHSAQYSADATSPRNTRCMKGSRNSMSRISGTSSCLVLCEVYSPASVMRVSPSSKTVE